MSEYHQNDAACSVVPMKVDRIFDSCSDKDCITNVQVTLECGELPQSITLVKTRCVSIENICMNVEPIPFNRGYFSVDLTFTFGVELLAYERACDCPIVLRGCASAAKSVILYGGESNTKTFFSNGMRIGETNSCCEVVNLPTAAVQCVDPIALETRISGMCSNHDDAGCCRHRTVLLTLGVFSIVELSRPVTMMVAAYPYTVPKKTCSCETDSPCEVFSRISFPTEEFLPQGNTALDSGTCGCGGTLLSADH
ncbi:MAG: hypothetical protein IKM30_06255 [Oscillospiraceae bacterium]|nr:hypothetical protein [Oscillospiraceae bacterium]